MLRKLAWLALCLILSGVLFFGTRAGTSVPASTLESAMFDEMKTYCFGRYLVDVPRDAELEYQDNNYAVGTIKSGFDVRKFRAMLNEKLEKRKEPDRQKKDDAFMYVRSLYPEGERKQIIVSRADFWGDISYAVDAFALNPEYKPGSGYFFFLSGDSYGDENLDEILERYRNILSSVRYRFEDEIPKEPGFCFENGFVANDGKTSQNEDAQLTFILKDHPDVKIDISTYSTWEKGDTLLERTQKARDYLTGKVKSLKAQARDINGMKGEEIFVTFPTSDQTGYSHVFTWETRGEINNVLKPGVFLEIETGHSLGEEKDSSLTTPQARALYEAVLKTIRIRPTGEAQPASSQQEEIKP